MKKVDRTSVFAYAIFTSALFFNADLNSARQVAILFATCVVVTNIFNLISETIGSKD